MGGDAPTLSVIVATFNRSNVLRLALESVLAQEHSDFEVWVVGDGCSDDSARVVQSIDDPRVRWVNLERNSGSQAFPNNEGLRRARGRFIAFIGHDDLWLPWHVRRAIEVLEQTPADVAYGLCAALGPEGVREAFGPPRADVHERDRFVPPSSWVLRRSIAMSAGPWRDPSTLPNPVDFDYWRRMGAAGARFAFSPTLSVLKFPSVWFDQAYRDVGMPPQASYAARLHASPSQLERDLLFELAVLQAQASTGGDPPVRTALRKCAGVVRRAAARAMGGPEGPLLAPLTRWQLQRVRRRYRRERGLGPM